MDEQLQYADLLEIPVNTCTVTTKKPKKRRMKISPDRLKARAVEKSNLAADSARLAANAEAAAGLPCEAPPAYPAEENSAETSRISGDVPAFSGTTAEYVPYQNATYSGVADRAAPCKNAGNSAPCQTAGSASPCAGCVYAAENDKANAASTEEKEAASRENAAQVRAAESEILTAQAAENCPPELPQSVLARPMQAEEQANDAISAGANFDEDSASETEESGVSLSDVMDELPPASPYPNENNRAEKRRKIRAERYPGGRKTGRKIAMISACVLTAIVSAFFLFNTFYLKLDLWGTVTGAHAKAPDDRLHDAFSLVLPAKSQPECKDGVLVIVEKGGVYAPADGVVSKVTAAEDGTYTVEISHSDRFKTVITGASMAFNTVGDTVYRQQPVAYCGGEIQTTVAFFENGALLTGLKIENGVPAF